MTRGLGAIAVIVSFATLVSCTEDRSDVGGAATTTSTTASSPTGGGGGGGGGARQPRVGMFQPFNDCAELLDYVTTEALEHVGPYGLGGGPYYYDTMAGGAERSVADEAPPMTMTAASATTGDGFSTTNTQEIGVDEGDVVETDGRYVYSVLGQTLLVTDVDDERVVERVALLENGASHQLLLDISGHRLAVISQSWGGSVSDVVITLYDTTDPGDLRRVHRTHLEGYVVAARAVDGVARLVVSTPLGSQLRFVQPGFAIDEDEATARNKQIIQVSTAPDWLPRRFNEDENGRYGDVTPALDCNEIGNPEEFSGLGISWVATLDLRGNDAEPDGAAGVVATGEQVYASTSSLYIATVPWDWQFCCANDIVRPKGPPPTAIHQFDLTASDGAEYVASGQVDGTLLNSYSMSEFDGVLRVATTIWAEDFGSQQDSGVHVLRRDGNVLQEIGSVRGLGKGEQIQAVRFLGELGYVVTFRQVDPLYVIDLRDPSNPRVAGELKIPGFSSYLHPVGDGFLLGVGADATEEGRVIGGQLSLFDVRDPANPQRLSTVSIGSGQSEVAWDPHAFLYWEAEGSIVVPTAQGWACPLDRGCPDLKAWDNAALVARYTDGELLMRGVVSHPDDELNPDVWCWYGPGIRRSMVIDDRLVTISERGMLISSLDDLSPQKWITFSESSNPCQFIEG